jgi:hypothetical protein
MYLQWTSQDMASFLREVGTPVLRQELSDPNVFHDASGFYVFVQEGWAVRFDSQLGSQLHYTNGLSSLMDKMNL